MKILMRTYLLMSQLLYLWALHVWVDGALLAYLVLGTTSYFDFVLWLISVPVFAYPFLVTACSVFAWKNHIHKPIQSAIVNLIPMLWIIAYWILWLMIY
ncbi:hypothetical protein [Ureibacillus manganicus]|uniref:Uncharacterized protein n=1 Tax=Ureibacillus manganicus DSM 26584 TaxID=1384049 RepID=A0A0A3I9E8_9BACL|nr:hypothetical protein [Ureibacillus manganicus]KGR79408.1 hypothetical protein CD29_06860 [Ureibacillus manganicus DSM 26584]